MKLLNNVLSKKQIDTLIVTGAGFSCNANLPVEKDVIPNAVRYFRPNDKRFMNEFEKLLKSELGVIDILDHSVEELLTKIQMLAFYSDKDPYQILTLNDSILKLLSYTLRVTEKELDDSYYKFLEKHKDNSAFITFNYDLLLERLFDELGYNWTYFIEKDITFDQKILKQTKYKKVSDVEDYSDLLIYLKLHGSFNWHFCWNCFKTRITTSKFFGVSATGLPEHEFFMINCSSEECINGASPMLKPLVIPPTLIKYYHIEAIRILWVLYELLLKKVETVIVIGSSLRNEDVLFLNSLSYLNMKNKHLNQIVFINPDGDLIKRVSELTHVKVSHYNQLSDYLSSTA